MDNLEALKGAITMFKNDKVYLKERGHTLIASRFQIAQEALEKQIPKKPTNYTKEYDDLLNMGYIQRYCDCGNKIHRTQSYCDDCGQKIDWNLES